MTTPSLPNPHWDVAVEALLRVVKEGRRAGVAIPSDDPVIQLGRWLRTRATVPPSEAPVFAWRVTVLGGAGPVSGIVLGEAGDDPRELFVSALQEAGFGPLPTAPTFEVAALSAPGVVGVLIGRFQEMP